MVVAVLLAVSLQWSSVLEGPWKFRPGDDMRWAAPTFDDRAWGTIDLAAPSDANDGDQGITHFAPGWAARGYAGYQGYAWYRLRVTNALIDAGDLELLGPAMVDSAYQVYANGKLVGGIGDFSQAIPLAYGIHPMKFRIARLHGPLTLAVRVWMAPFAAGPKAGGMHVAPIVGNVEGAQAAYALQWFEKIRAFALEIAQAFVFGVLALAALALVPVDPAKRALTALAAALSLTALVRVNLAVFWCLSLESVASFVHVQGMFLVPITLGVWTLAWSLLLCPKWSRWIVPSAAAMTAIYTLMEILKRPSFNGEVLPSLAPMAAFISMSDRYAFVALWVCIGYLALREPRRESLVAIPAFALTSVGQFSAELARMGIPSIWFPFGMGVTLANYAYVLSSLAITGLLLTRVYRLKLRV